MLIEPQAAQLVVIDIQERLAPAIADGPQATRNARRLLTAAERLAIPILVTEQYVRGLGPTVDALRPLPAAARVREKIHFSAAREPEILAALADPARPQLILAGMETHVCVLQSALGLLAAGHPVFVVADASGSRTPANHAAGLDRLRAAGAGIVTTEMVLFEWLQRAATDDFRALLPLIR